MTNRRRETIGRPCADEGSALPGSNPAKRAGRWGYEAWELRQVAQLVIEVSPVAALRGLVAA